MGSTKHTKNMSSRQPCLISVTFSLVFNHKSILILMADSGIILRVYNADEDTGPLMKTLDIRSLETLDRECCRLGFPFIYFKTIAASENMTNIVHDDPGLCIAYLLSEIKTNGSQLIYTTAIIIIKPCKRIIIYKAVVEEIGSYIC